MRFALNLAREPSENRRRAWIIWGGSCALAAVALVVLAAITFTNWRSAATVRARTAAVQARLAPLRRQRERLVAALQQPAAQAAMHRAAYLNQLIDQKAVSWTRLFERLEALLPSQVQLLSLRPAQRHGKTALVILVSAPSVTAALPFLHEMEEAPDFAAPQLSEVSSHKAGAGNDAMGLTSRRPVRLEIVAFYRPKLGPADLHPSADRRQQAFHPRPGRRP